MKLQVFNAGLNTRLAPHLIQAQEAIEYTNVDNAAGTLLPIKDKSATGVALSRYAYYFEAAAKWESSTTQRDYLEYQQSLYYTEPGAIPKYYDGTTRYLLGILAPTPKVVVAIGAAGVLIGTYTYVMTYYNQTKGVESQPTPVSNEIVVTNEKVEITGLPVSSDSQVNQKRIYRVGGDLTSFSLVATVSNATTVYTDNIADADIPGDDMVAVDYRQAAAGTKYLTEAYGILFGVVGDKLYYSQIGRFTAWPVDYFIDFPVEITGIAAIGTGVLVFTKYRTYIVTGTSHVTFNKRLFSGDQGCLTFSSIQNVKGMLLWVSSDGICTVNGALVDVVSKGKLDKVVLNIVNSAFHDEVYYAMQADGIILAYDFRFGTIIKYLELGVDRLALANDVLYGYSIATYYPLFANAATLPFAYKSPLLTEGEFTLRKVYKDVKIKSSGNITIEVFISGVSVAIKSYSTDDSHELKLPEESKNGYSIQFRVTGTGEVDEINYTVSA